MLIPHKGHADTIQVYSVTVMTHVKALQAGHSSQGTSESITPATVPEIIKMFYKCGGERQTFACRLLMPVKAGLPPSSEGPPPSSVLLPPCCVVWRGTRKRRHQGGITALWDGKPTLRDGRPTLWDGRPTLCEGRPALRDAIGRHGALWDGRPTLWDDRPTLCEGRPALRDAIGRHGALWDGRPTLWDDRPTLCEGRPAIGRL